MPRFIRVGTAPKTWPAAMVDLFESAYNDGSALYTAHQQGHVDALCALDLVTARPPNAYQSRGEITITDQGNHLGDRAFN